MPLALINPRVIIELIIVAVLAAAGWYCYTWAFDRGAARVQARWNMEKAGMAQQSAMIASEALATTKALQASADKRQGEANVQIQTLNSSLALAVAGLSDRAPRPGPGGVSSHPPVAGSCYPSQLFREDAAAFVELGGQADQLRIELQKCYDRYEAARSALK